MSRMELAAVGWVMFLVSGCGSGSGGGNSAATRASCNAYCDAVIAKNCPLPIYDSVDECRAECAGAVGSIPGRCQALAKAFYDCEAGQADICEDTGCLAQLNALDACGAGGPVGTGGGTGTGGVGTGGAGTAGSGSGGTGTGGRGTGGTGGTGTGGAGGSGSWTPAALGARLVLWLDAGKETSVANGARMAAWMDQSPAMNNAGQSVMNSRPIFTTAGINGLPSVSFDGSVTFFRVADAETLRWGTQSFGLMVVARGATNTGLNTMLYQKSDVADPFAGPALFLNSNKPSSAMKAAAQVDGGFYALSNDGIDASATSLLGGRLLTTATGAMLEMRLNGARQGVLSVSPAINVDAVGRDVIIGHNGYNPSPGFQAFKGDISEIVAVKGALTDGELQSLEGYLKAKYGLP